MSRSRIAAGQRYGRWEVIGHPVSVPGRQNTMVECQCECGTAKMVACGNLLNGKSSSCGCRKNELTIKRSTKHGDATGGISRLYKIWSSMRQRCRPDGKPGVSEWEHYGGRGIVVCDEWQDYQAFRCWANANGYADDLTIERNDVDGNYCPANCTWIPRARQARNRTDSIRLTAFGITASIHDWAEDARCSVHRKTIIKRLRRGWIVEDAIARPRTTRWDAVT